MYLRDHIEEDSVKDCTVQITLVSGNRGSSKEWGSGAQRER